jgi:hypothetical protein
LSHSNGTFLKLVLKRRIGARKRGKKNVRTKRESHETHHKTNLGGHEVVRATIPIANLEFLHKSLNLWTFLIRTLRGGGN